MSKRVKGLLGVLIEFMVITVMVNSAVGWVPPDLGYPWTWVYVEPPKKAVMVGETFTVNITVFNVTQLWSWEFNLTWNPKVINCTEYEIPDPPFLVDPLPPTDKSNTTMGFIWLRQSYNTTKDPTSPPQNGTGTLAKATFKAIAPGGSVLHFTRTRLEREVPSRTIDHRVADGEVIGVIDHAIVFKNMTYHAFTEVNSEISPIPIVFSQVHRLLNFNITGLPETSGFCNTTIPKNFLKGEPNWLVFVDSFNTTHILSENDTHSSLYFTYDFPNGQSIRRIQIIGTWAILTPPTLYVEVAADPSTVESGENSTISVRVTGDDGTVVPEANVTLSSDKGGTFSQKSGFTDSAGFFNCTFTAPSVTTETSVTISAEAKKEGYFSGLGHKPISVTAVVTELPWIPIILVVIACAVVAAAVLIVRRRRKPQAKEGMIKP